MTYQNEGDINGGKFREESFKIWRCRSVATTFFEFVGVWWEVELTSFDTYEHWCIYFHNLDGSKTKRANSNETKRYFFSFGPVDIDTLGQEGTKIKCKCFSSSHYLKIVLTRERHIQWATSLWSVKKGDRERDSFKNYHWLNDEAIWFYDRLHW